MFCFYVAMYTFFSINVVQWRIRNKKNILSNQRVCPESLEMKNCCFRFFLFTNNQIIIAGGMIRFLSLISIDIWKSKFSSLTKNSETKISKISNFNAFFEEIYLWLCTLTPLISRLIKCLILCQLVKVATKLAKRRPFFYLIFSTLPWSLQKLWTQTKICSQHAYIKSERNT